MLIKFYCKNGHYYEVEELELLVEPRSHRYCYCGEKLSILNVDEIVQSDIERRVEGNIDRWVKMYGWDYVIDLVKKYKNLSVGKLYITELEKRGFKLKKE